MSEWEYQRRTPIDIYGPPGTEALVRGAIQYLTPNAEIRWSEGKRTPMASIFHGHDVAPGMVFQDEAVKVMAVENTHFHFTSGSPGYGKYKSYSYRFETPGRVVVFTGDTGPSDALTELAKGADCAGYAKWAFRTKSSICTRRMVLGRSGRPKNSKPFFAT